ncbi:MAG: DUF4783 domain-containing protein [Bacteroidota bacterium]
MKKAIYTTLVAFLVFALEVQAQNEVVESIKTAMKSGSSKELSKYFSQNVDVTIDGDIQPFSKTQAEYELRDFFKNHVPDNFSIIHQGASKGGLHFAIGQYVSKSDTFRIFFRIKGTEGKYLIHEITIDEE